ncbi:hypothetical protein D3C74_301690 [compost metagenome]
MLGSQRSGHTDYNDIRLCHRCIIRAGREQTCLHERLQDCIIYTDDIRMSGTQLGYLGGIDIDPVNPISCLGHLDGHGQTYITETDDNSFQGAIMNRLYWGRWL